MLADDFDGLVEDAALDTTPHAARAIGVNISGATSSTYTVVEADEGHLLRVVETATDADGGPSTTSTSAVADQAITVAITVASNTGTNGTNKATAVFTVTFTEPVTGVTKQRMLGPTPSRQANGIGKLGRLRAA